MEGSCGDFNKCHYTWIKTADKKSKSSDSLQALCFKLFKNKQEQALVLKQNFSK